jgi:hypothetical protein
VWGRAGLCCCSSVGGNSSLLSSREIMEQLSSPFQGVHLHHVAHESEDVQRASEFYQQVGLFCLNSIHTVE